MTSVTAETPLGVPGYTFADLHRPDRLASLYERFCEEVQATDSALWQRWDAYRGDPGAARPSLVVSNLLVEMAPHVSRFVTRLFQVGAKVDAVAQATRDQDNLFRFKIDFVRRRVLPLLKADARHAPSAADDRAVAALVGQASATGSALASLAFERAIALAACGLLDREKLEKDAVQSDLDLLKRWCASRVHDAAYRGWVSFRFPETLDYWHLVEVVRPRADGSSDAAIPEWMKIGRAHV